MTKSNSELERHAYIIGDTTIASLLGEVEDVLNERDDLDDKLDGIDIEQLQNDLRAYKSFFESCFDRLGAYYPAPSVTSDYDCSVIFAAIEKAEGLAE